MQSSESTIASNSIHWLKDDESLSTHILIVDDEEAFGLMLKKAINEKTGFTCSFVRDAKEALKVLDESIVDIVITDIKMPDINGFELTRIIKTKYNSAVIAITGYNEDFTFEEAIDSGADDFIEKPLNISELIFRLKRILWEQAISFKHKQIEKALQLSEKKYKDIYENAIEGIFQLTPDGQFIDVNPAFATMFGYDSPEDLIQDITNIAQQIFINAKEGERYKHLLDRDGTINNFETQFYRKDGSKFWVNVRARSVKDAEGNILYYAGTCEDIIYRKNSEELLKKEMDRTKLLLELYLKAPKMADKELYDYVLDKTVELTDSEIGFFHQVADNGKTIILTTWNAEALKSCTAAYDTHYSLEEAGNWVDCVRYKKPIVYNDFPNAPNQKGLPEGHAPLKRFMSIPVIDEDARLIFGVGNKVEEYDEYDVNQLQLVANELYKIIIARKSDNDLKQSFDLLQKALIGTVQAMASVIGSRDPYTAGHQNRVADLSHAIALQMSLQTHQTDGIRMAALIHDLGKVAVPAEILSKPGKISDDEFGIIKSHPQVGYDILKDIEFPWPIAQVVYQHHERMGGSGYPQGLSGDDILIEARILAVADVIEAMASHRPYRPSLGMDVALEEISNSSGEHYDPNVVNACIDVITKEGFNFNNTKDN